MHRYKNNIFTFQKYNRLMVIQTNQEKFKYILQIFPVIYSLLLHNLHLTYIKYFFQKNQTIYNPIKYPIINICHFYFELFSHILSVSITHLFSTSTSSLFFFSILLQLPSVQYSTFTKY